jgi:hypothetical protein
MITNRDWDDALDSWIAAERERLGNVYFPELRKPQRRSMRSALAYAVAAIALIGLLTRVAIDTRLARESSKPYVHESRYDLREMHARGTPATTPIELPGDEERYLLTVPLSDAPHDPSYRIELTDESQTIWQSRSAQPSNGSFDVSIARAFLRPGTYRVMVYGVDAAGSHLRDQYRFHVAPAPQKAKGRIFSSD